MSHEIETMAYANAVPWHGLGKKVDPSIGVDGMLVAAGLDWEVTLEPCFFYVPGTKKAVKVGRYALVRSSDQKVLTVTGDNWNPVQNREAFELFKSYAEAGGATMETAGSLRGGKVIWGLASLNEQFTVAGKKDIVKGYLLLVSHHEVGNSTRAFLTAVRVVCANTMRMAMSANGRNAHRQDHMKAFDPELAKQAIGLMRVRLGEMKLEANALAQLRMSEFESVRFLSRWFQPMEDEQAALLKAIDKGKADARDKKAFDKFIGQLLENTDLQAKPMQQVIHSMNNAPGAQPGTGWGVLNGVTHWCDHVAGTQPDARLHNAWFGDRSQVKLKVNSALLEMVQ